MSAQPRWYPAYVGIGSNLDDPVKQVRRAISTLSKLADCSSFRVSSLYRSAPLGPAAQPDFINAVAAFLTRKTAQSLLTSLQSIENDHGRTRSDERWGPRTLDLDLLLYSGAVIDEPKLTVPHPRIHERNFVLLPLCELAPHLIVPGVGKVVNLARGIADSDIRIERLGQ